MSDIYGSKDARITKIEWARLEGKRPRHAGSNARLGAHGLTVPVPVARVTLDDGTVGFGGANLTRDRAESLVGARLSEVFTADAPGGLAERFITLEYPLWDIAGKRANKPVYALIAPEGVDTSAPLRVPCYDTSLYFDDLHLADDAAAVDLLVSEARAGWDNGHRAFKIKVGRGALHMELEAGMRRDIAIIRAVRDAVGPDIPILIDANNGWNLNLSKRVLSETADCKLYWLEEAFHEDPVLYRNLKAWMAEQGISTLIADGEGQASPTLLDWAKDGLIDVVQYDVFSPGFTRWLALGKQMAGGPARTAPHHYGRHLGNYVSGHLQYALPAVQFVEWDEATTPGIDAPGYAVENGQVTIPATPGFGLELEDAAFTRARDTDGFSVEDD